MAGYYGYSMSNNAIVAYDNGEMPKHKWTKKNMLEAISDWLDSNRRISTINFHELTKQELFDQYFVYSGWHHTSKFYNITHFYSLDQDALLNVSIIDKKAEEEYQYRKKKAELLKAKHQLEKELERKKQSKQVQERKDFIKQHGYCYNSAYAVYLIYPECLQKIKMLNGKNINSIIYRLYRPKHILQGLDIDYITVNNIEDLKNYYPPWGFDIRKNS